MIAALALALASALTAPVYEPPPAPHPGPPVYVEVFVEPERVAVHAVCRENVFWETLEALKAEGASAMLVLPVEKMLA